MIVFDGVILTTFWILILLGLRLPGAMQHLREKSRPDWILDLCGLGIQGVVIPAMQIGVAYKGLGWLLPQMENSLVLHPLWAFIFCVVLVDYGYYWNHRWLHSHGWALHRVHHTVTQLDVWGTSRNSLWSSLFILYLWVHALMIYWLKDSSGYLWGISLTAMLDLWRHSRLGPRPEGWLYAVLSPWVVLPQDHALHHSSVDIEQSVTYNYGANFKVWDDLHGTGRKAAVFPERLGIATSLTFWQKLFYPFEAL